MDLKLVSLGWDYSRRKKKWILLLAALGFTGYGAYKVYQSPAVARKRARLFKLLGALISVIEAVSNSSEAIGVVSRDLKEFLESDSDKIPNSLKQICKILTSQEISETLIRVTRVLTAGVLQGSRLAAKDARDNSPSFADQVMDKVFSPAGSGFASIVVGSFARNLVMSFFSDEQLNGGLGASSIVKYTGADEPPDPKWVALICSDKCRELIGNCVQSFVSTAVTVYLDKTMTVNTYDEVFKGLTNTKHEERVKEMFTSVCNGAVETFIRTSHEVLTSSNAEYLPSNHAYSATEVGHGLSKIGHEALHTELKAKNLYGDIEDNGLVQKMFSTLAVPNNKKFVLDVTGRVTFETVRSFLEFLLEKLYSGLKRSVNVVNEEIACRSIAAVRYVTEKSSVIVTLCLSLCLHILDSSWFLVTA